MKLKEEVGEEEINPVIAVMKQALQRSNLKVPRIKFFVCQNMATTQLHNSIHVVVL